MQRMSVLKQSKEMELGGLGMKAGGLAHVSRRLYAGLLPRPALLANKGRQLRAGLSPPRS